jgi:hypothetical protein
MRLALPLFGGLLLVLSACGGRDADRPAGRPTVVRELHVQSDYGQIYIYDPQTQDVDWSEDDNPFVRAMDNGSDSRRFIGYDSGLIDVLTPSQYNWDAPMRIEISDGPPPLDADAWDHIVEVPLPVPSGTLCFEASGGGEPIETQIPPGTYRARFSGRGYVPLRAGEIEGHESYRLELWPADDEAEPELVKYWHGYDPVHPVK